MAKRPGFYDSASVYNEGSKAPGFGNYTPAPAPPPGSNPQQLPSSNTTYPTAGSPVRSDMMSGLNRSFAQRGAAVPGLMGSISGDRGAPGAAGMVAPQAMGRPSAYGGTGVSPGQFSGPNAVAQSRGYSGAPGGSLEAIQAEMARRNVGAQLGPRNAALSGYMMGK
jgi:hypothetical protein